MKMVGRLGHLRSEENQREMGLLKLEKRRLRVVLLVLLMFLNT